MKGQVERGTEPYTGIAALGSGRDAEIIRAFAKAIDARDDYTGRHSEHVADLMADLGGQLDFTEKEVNIAYFSGLVHDIGKIGVPESILNKPAKLTETEFSCIKCHPDVGADILAEIQGFEKISEAVRYHHERYDGKGYPYSMKGKKIPLLSRMLALCDAYDAMTTDRCYRQPVSAQSALLEIERLKGFQFDPELSRIFINLIEERNM